MNAKEIFERIKEKLVELPRVAQVAIGAVLVLFVGALIIGLTRPPRAVVAPVNASTPAPAPAATAAPAASAAAPAAANPAPASPAPVLVAPAPATTAPTAAAATPATTPAPAATAPAAPATAQAPVVTQVPTRPAAQLTPEQEAQLKPGALITLSIPSDSAVKAYDNLQTVQFTPVGSAFEEGAQLSIGGVPEVFKKTASTVGLVQVEKRGYIKVEKAGIYTFLVTGESRDRRMLCSLYVSDKTVPATSAKEPEKKFSLVSTVALDSGYQDVMLRCAFASDAQKIEISASAKGEADAMPRMLELKAIEPEKK